MTGQANLAIERRGNLVILRFLCELDASRALQLQGAIKNLLTNDTASFIVDLQDVPFLDSHGVGIFAALLRHAHGKGGVLAFCRAEGQPKSVLKMVGFDDMVQYYATVEAAIHVLQKKTE